MKKMILISVSSLVAAAALFVLFAYITLTFDPFGWGVTQSSRFSWKKFETVKVGDRIDVVVDTLGEPIRPAEPLVTLTRDPSYPCTAGGCKKYLFAGGNFGPTFKEAIIVTDSHGIVVNVNARQE